MSVQARQHVWWWGIDRLAASHSCEKLLHVQMPQHQHAHLFMLEKPQKYLRKPQDKIQVWCHTIFSYSPKHLRIQCYSTAPMEMCQHLVTVRTFAAVCTLDSHWCLWNVWFTLHNATHGEERPESGTLVRICTGHITWTSNSLWLKISDFSPVTSHGLA